MTFDNEFTKDLTELFSDEDDEDNSEIVSSWVRLTNVQYSKNDSTLIGAAMQVYIAANSIYNICDRSSYNELSEAKKWKLEKQLGRLILKACDLAGRIGVYDLRKSITEAANDEERK